MISFGGAYKGKRVLLTGHTGFKGSWMSLWLSQLGAEVIGLSIDIPTDPAMFELARIADVVDHRFGDIRNNAALNRLVFQAKPDIVFHLAAQSLVRLSYVEPIRTLETNVSGTAAVLEAVRASGHRCAVVVVTSDKCYSNDGRREGYRESDPMGGDDPYSMSKGAAELVVDSWRKSYFSALTSPVRVASARAGNVIGGGDWSADRIITDCIAALTRGEPIGVRNPLATRPWQHVLEPLAGYLWLGRALLVGESVAEGWNFGPDQESVRNVKQLVDELIHQWGTGSWALAADAAAPKEAMTLGLNCEKAHAQLRWFPVWDFKRAVGQTVSWFKNWHERREDIRFFSLRQIEEYCADARAKQVEWATKIDAL